MECSIHHLSSMLLLEVLYGPHLAVAGLEESTGHRAEGWISHIVVVSMGWKRSWPFVPHLLQTAGHNLFGRVPIRALILNLSTRFADHGQETRMCSVRAVVFSLFIRARFTLGPTLKRWQTLTFPAKLVDAIDTVLRRVA